VNTSTIVPPTAPPTLTEVVDWPGTVGLVEEVDLPLNDLVASGEFVPAPPPQDVAPWDVRAAPPVLTDVFEPAPETVQMFAPSMMLPEPPVPDPVPAPQVLAGVSEEVLVQKVLVEVQRQVDLMLEYRLRECLTPVLTRAADHMIRDTRQELASTLRDVVARAVAQELSRHRAR
jgi:hypothetical protein